MKKFPAIRAGEVVPGKLYLIPYRLPSMSVSDSPGLQWAPGTIVCTVEPGYQRGFVEVSNLKSYARYVTAEAKAVLLDDGSVKTLPVSRDSSEDEWKFCAVMSDVPTLKELPSTWMDDKITHIVKQLDLLEDKHRALLNLKKKIEAHARTS